MQDALPKSRRRHAGSALPEYVLPLILLGMATVAVLPSSTGLATWFQTLLGQSTNGTVVGGQLQINVAQSTAGGFSPPMPTASPPANQNATAP